MSSTPSGQAREISTNEPRSTAIVSVLISRTTPSGPLPTPPPPDDVEADAPSPAGAAVPPAAVVVDVTVTVVVVAVSAATVNLNDPSPPGVPSWLLTVQPTTQLPRGRLLVSGTVSVRRSAPTCGVPTVNGSPSQTTATLFCWPSASLNFISTEVGEVVTVDPSAGVELASELAAAAGEAPRSRPTNSAPSTAMTARAPRPTTRRRAVEPALGTRATGLEQVGCMFSRRDVSPQ